MAHDDGACSDRGERPPGRHRQPMGRPLAESRNRKVEYEGGERSGGLDSAGATTIEREPKEGTMLDHL